MATFKIIVFYILFCIIKKEKKKTFSFTFLVVSVFRVRSSVSSRFGNSRYLIWHAASKNTYQSIQCHQGHYLHLGTTRL